MFSSKITLTFWIGRNCSCNGWTCNGRVSSLPHCPARSAVYKQEVWLKVTNASPLTFTPQIQALRKENSFLSWPNALSACAEVKERSFVSLHVSFASFFAFG